MSRPAAVERIRMMTLSLTRKELMASQDDRVAQWISKLECVCAGTASRLQVIDEGDGSAWHTRSIGPAASSSARPQ